MDHLTPEQRSEIRARLERLAKENGQTPEERIEFLAKKENATPDEQMELVFRTLLKYEKWAGELNAELQEKLKTSEDKWKVVEEFAQQHGMKRTDRPLPPALARLFGRPEVIQLTAIAERFGEGEFPE